MRQLEHLGHFCLIPLLLQQTYEGGSLLESFLVIINGHRKVPSTLESLGISDFGRKQFLFYEDFELITTMRCQVPGNGFFQAYSQHCLDVSFGNVNESLRFYITIIYDFESKSPLAALLNTGCTALVTDTCYLQRSTMLIDFLELPE